MTCPCCGSSGIESHCCCPAWDPDRKRPHAGKASARHTPRLQARAVVAGMVRRTLARRIPLLALEPVCRRCSCVLGDDAIPESYANTYLCPSCIRMLGGEARAVVWLREAA